MTWLLWIQLGATGLVLFCLWEASRYRAEAREDRTKAAAERERAVALLDHAQAHLDEVDRLPEVQCRPDGLH